MKAPQFKNRQNKSINACKNKRAVSLCPDLHFIYMK